MRLGLLGEAGFIGTLFIIGIATTGFSAPSAESDRGQQNPTATATAPAASVVVPTYADTAGGLERLAGDIFRAAKKNDTTMFNSLISSLSQPVRAEWFQDAFGDESDLMFKEYPGGGPGVARALEAFFSKLQQAKFTQITGQRHETSCDDNSGELIYPVW